MQTFSALVSWVEGGITPEGDNVLDPAEVADPNFGCKWTDKVSARSWDNYPPAIKALVQPPACPAP